MFSRSSLEFRLIARGKCSMHKVQPEWAWMQRVKLTSLSCRRSRDYREFSIELFIKERWDGTE